MTHDGCGCNDCGCSEELTTEELVENNNIILNTLIDLLVEKKVISEEELRAKLAKVEEEIGEAKENSEKELAALESDIESDDEEDDGSEDTDDEEDSED
ncbi:MAG: hypothetical protein HGA85_01555 [Nanoarchaeota archaeon]|nr:hypothetical protein [Nanoarchaeota archaeon]